MLGQVSPVLQGKMEKKMRRKRFWLRIKLFATALIILTACGWYARHDYEKRLDKRLYDGIIYGLTAIEAHEPAPEIPLTENEQIFQEIENLFGDEAANAKRVACCENQGKPVCSYLNPKAEGPTDDWGIFQIHRPSHKVPVKYLTNWQINLNIAKQLFDEQGWFPWRYSRHCHGVK